MPSEYITAVLSKEKLERYASRHTEYYSCAGYYKKAASHSVVRKRQEFYLFMLCVDGCGTLCGNGREYAIKKGDCMVCYEGMPVAYTSSKEQPWSLYWIHFDLKKNSPMRSFLYSKDVNPERPVVNVSGRLPLIDLFERIINFNDALADDLQFGLYQNLFLTLLYTGLAAYQTAGSTNGYVAAAVKYIENNMNQKITLDELAAQVHLSKYYLAHLFRETMDVSPARYIIEKRMQYAKTLLASSSLTISEIAKEAGFDNAMYFSNAFRQNEGVSPRLYRMQLSGNASDSNDGDG